MAETAIESLAGYAYDDKHNGKHTDGRHDDKYPHGIKHNKHDKDATFAYQIIQTDRTFTYDDAGKLLSSTETEDNYGTYIYTYEYDADGNRISETGKIGTDKVQLTYEYTLENRLQAVYDADELLVAMAYDGDGNRVFQLNYNLHTDEDWKANSDNGNGSNKDNSGSGKGNATNAEEYDSQNQCGILFPVEGEVSDTEQSLIDQIKTEGKQKDYELIEYINDVNREYTEVLVEQNINGKLDTAYIYGNERLSLDRFDGSAGYYLYDPRGSVTGITNEEGQIYQSYRYDAFGKITFGAPTYENEYTYNGESYNANIESQYLRARYYDVVNGNFLTEDSYLGNINEPLTLNRYNYCLSSPLNYKDPSGYEPDKQGEILYDLYLYGDGSSVYKDDWGEYMTANRELTDKVEQYIIPIGKTLDKGESIEIDFKTQMEITPEDGNNDSGYTLLYGTNWDAGGFQMKGNISKDDAGNITYDIDYTWNDIMDPNYQYFSDFLKVAGLKFLKLFDKELTLKDYEIHISWHDTTVINEENPKMNEGWLKDYDPNFIIKSKQVLKFPTGWWNRDTKASKVRLQQFIDRIEKWKEEHPDYYEDCKKKSSCFFAPIVNIFYSS